MTCDMRKLQETKEQISWVKTIIQYVDWYSVKYGECPCAKELLKYLPIRTNEKILESLLIYLSKSGLLNMMGKGTDSFPYFFCVSGSGAKLITAIEKFESDLREIEERINDLSVTADLFSDLMITHVVFEKIVVEKG